MQKSIFLLVSLLLLASCSMIWNTPEKSSQVLPQPVVQKEILPQEVKVSTWATTKDFWSGFVLIQTIVQTELTYSGNTIKIWSHTPPQKVPFIWDDACAIVYKGFAKLEKNTNEAKQSVWDALSEQDQKACLAENLMKKIDVRPTQNPRFSILIQAWYENVLRTIFDIQTLRTYGGIESEIIQDFIQDIIFVDGHILFLTRSNFDASDELLIFSDGFVFQKKWTTGWEPHATIEKIENISQTGATLVLKEFNYTTSKESSRKEVVTF